MPWAIVRLLAACVALWYAQLAAAAPETLVLRDEVGGIDARGLARSWVDPEGTASLAQVLRAPDTQFHASEPGVLHRLPAQGALWLHLRLQRAAKERQDWLLKLPMPVIDLVTVYQQEGGVWRSETAGDTVAVGRWPEHGRYPVFRLDVPAGETRDIYLRIQHSTPARFPLELLSEGRFADVVQMEYLGLGAALGALLLLIAGCLAKAWAYRDPGFAWYAAYAGLTSLAMAAYTGVAAQFLWPNFGLLQDAPTNMLACAAVAAAILFVRKTLGLRRRLPWLDRLTLGLGIAGAAVAALGAVLPKAVFLPAMGAYVCVACLVTVGASVVAWRRGDPVAGWVFAAQFPLVSAVIVTVTRNLGWVDLPFVPQYVVILGLALEVPLLLVALFIRSRDRHGAEIREQALSTHDALTGLLAPHLFEDRLRQVVLRHKRDGESAAVMFIDLVNYQPIKDTFSTAVAEQSLLRSVIKLRRLLRDVDTVARMGEARFGVILEGAASRPSVTERASRLIAAGLMPLPGLKPDVTLQFHVAALLLNERPMEADEVQAALAEQLGRMSRRTRRPIRFIAPDEVPPPDDNDPDSALFSPESDRAQTSDPLGVAAP
jgi:two-component system, sensor histidine kinase LadS